MGACVAWGLARQGLRVCVLDEGDIALRASRANFALIWVQGKGIGFPAYTAWTKAAAEAWPRLAAELRSETGINVGLDQPGGVHALPVRPRIAGECRRDGAPAQPARYRDLSLRDPGSCTDEGPASGTSGLM